jgi:hypothetical protein
VAQYASVNFHESQRSIFKALICRVNYGLLSNSEIKPDDPWRHVDAPLELDLFGFREPSLIVNAAELGRVCGCGGETWLTLPGKGPHSMAVKCATCGRHGGWVAHDVAAALRGKGGLQ